MKYATNWKLFAILIAATLISSVMALPYALGLAAGLKIVITPALIIAQIVQAGILFSILIYFGLRLAARIGFGLPILESVLKGKRVGGKLQAIWKLSVGSGVLAAALIIIISFFFPKLSLDFLRTEMAIPTWKTLLVSFYGGIAEEVIMRLFFMTFLVWISFKIKRTFTGQPTAIGIWIAIILSSVIFGLGHLPITGAVVDINAAVIIRAIALNGVGGVIFGWLYWKRGLESAMIAHFTADIALHVITPLVASVLI